MPRPAPPLAPTGLTLLLLACALSCSAPGGPERIKEADWRPRQDGGSSAGDTAGDRPLPPPPQAACRPARSSEALPARSPVISDEVTPARETRVFTADLFNLFRSHCGACHVETKLGDFQVTARTFAKLVDGKVLQVMKTDDPAKVMPPPAGGGKPYSQRAPGDPVVELVTLLEEWIARDRPEDLFTIVTPARETRSRYLMSEEVGMRLTNLGDCVPNAPLIATSTQGMDERDEIFARATALPKTLAETDLVTFDAEELARIGVVAFVPAYPLWSDDSGKLRHIRVPRGKKVQFDKATQTFAIPPNTRFYKTFFKKVIDISGQERHRKIETRIIVTRPDRRRPDGTDEVTALFGTYVWNDDETEAQLLELPLRNGQPFRDRMLTYVTDEPKAQEIIDSMPPNLSFALEDENPGLLRRYAIPGSERCIQCHMGSPSKDFVLGFMPVQIARRPEGVGGVIEHTAEDELTQLQRLIDYGVIAGISAPDDIRPLEAPQGDRKPRNEHELRAQAYLLGNCAHCHNPRGFPSVKEPLLKEALDFMPSAAGGIFQFPLDRMSPLRRRGANLEVPMPYITPSLREYPVGPGSTANWAQKWLDCHLTPELCANRSFGVWHINAPWRSLLYRNVDTPFTYADDFVVFPHMPMHSAGFDCRAPRIVGEWMVSIPSFRDHPAREEAVPVAGARVEVDDSPQPYKEVRPGDPRYDDALSQARLRLNSYKTGERYNFCPDTRDIVDRAVWRQRPGDPLVPPADPVYDPADPDKLIQPGLGVPIRAHWVVTDLTEAPGDWYPRRPDWERVLVQGRPDDGLPAAYRRAQEDVIQALSAVTVSEEMRRFALTEVPLGLWQRKPGCDFGKTPKAGDFAGDNRPRWMTKTMAAADAPVYMQSPGAALFGTICVNCHGPAADSDGLLAEAITAMTGGEARVANLRDGLFGPLGRPGDNRPRVFVPTATTSSLTPDDWAARYMAWMALGGTQRVLPPAILSIVAATRVVGESRASNRISPTGSPNMLRLAQELCTHVLPAQLGVGGDLDAEFFRTGSLNWGALTGLIDRNGDAEMWQRLCSMGNRPVVRVPFVTTWDEKTGTPEAPLRINLAESLWWGDTYPADAPVMDHRGRVVTGLKPDNLFPLCVRKPSDPAQLARAEQFLRTHPVAGGAVIPWCPASLFAPDNKLRSEYDADTTRYDLIDVQRWATRGAVNAGVAIFVYLDQVARGNLKPTPAFNHCEQME